MRPMIVPFSEALASRASWFRLLAIPRSCASASILIGGIVGGILWSDASRIKVPTLIFLMDASSRARVNSSPDNRISRRLVLMFFLSFYDRRSPPEGKARSGVRSTRHLAPCLHPMATGYQDSSGKSTKKINEINILHLKSCKKSKQLFGGMLAKPNNGGLYVEWAGKANTLKTSVMRVNTNNGGVYSGINANF